VPASSPAADSVSPFGSAPALTLNVNGPGLPEAESSWSYAVPVAPPGSVAGETAIVLLEMFTLPAAPAFTATAAFAQSRAVTDCTGRAPEPVGPTAARSSVNSEPPAVAPQGVPRRIRSTV